MASSTNSDKEFFCENVISTNNDSESGNVELNENLITQALNVVNQHSAPISMDLPGLAKNHYVVYDHITTAGERRDSNLFYVKCEKKFYSSNVDCKYGKSLRCATDVGKGLARKCRARRILTKAGIIIGLNSSPPHTCVTDGEQRFKNLCAKNDLKERCQKIEEVASSSKFATVRSILKKVNEK